MSNISVIFTCKGRRELTELCLRRFREVMPEPYELIIVYDGEDLFYEKMLLNIGNPKTIIDNQDNRNRYELLNEGLSCARGPYYMHLENDFYWVDPTCLDAGIVVLGLLDIDFVRFEILPFTANQFDRITPVENHDICRMKTSTPYRFNFNPHIRKFKFPGNRLFPCPKIGESEQMVNEWYKGVSCCMTGDNFRHLGIYDEGGNYKEYYAERFFNKRGKRETNKEELLYGFNRLTNSLLYQKLFSDYLAER